MLDEREQKMLGVYAMVMLIGEYQDQKQEA